MTARIVYDEPASTYHRRELGVVSRSGLQRVLRSPAHYHAWATGQTDESDSPALAFGRALHAAVLEPEVFAAAFAPAPDFGDLRTRGAKLARDEWRAANAGRIAVDATTWQQIRGMDAAIRRHPLASRLLGAGRAEVTLHWQDPDTGMPCKSRPDWLDEERGVVVDLKSAEDARPATFARSVARYQYHLQDAWYRIGCAAAGLPAKNFVFLVVEKTAPYAVSICSLDEDAVTAGYDMARRGVDMIAAGVRTGQWPAYTDRIHTVSLPPWAAE